MNTNTFIMLFAIYSIATGLVVETIKKLLDEANRKYASNLYITSYMVLLLM